MSIDSTRRIPKIVMEKVRERDEKMHEYRNGFSLSLNSTCIDKVTVHKRVIDQLRDY